MAEDVSLVLPSALEPEQRLAICRHQVAQYELQFRLAQLEDALVEIRRVRRIRRTLLTNHKTQIAGQGRRANTRSRSVIDGIQDRIEKFARRYHAAYQALVKLDPSGKWHDTYLPFNDCDNRGPAKEPEEEGPGDGTWEPSWIWLVNPRVRDSPNRTDADEDVTKEEVNDEMRVEWTTSLARMERWAEEVELLQEEMRRTVTFLEWKSLDWMAKRWERLDLVTSDIQSGLDAYARKQAAVYRDLALSFSSLWRPILLSNELDDSWATKLLQKYGVPLEDLETPAPCDQAVVKPSAPSGTSCDQRDSQTCGRAGVNVDTSLLLDEADSYSSTDSSDLSDDVYESDDYWDSDFDDLDAYYE